MFGNALRALLSIRFEFRSSTSIKKIKFFEHQANMSTYFLSEYERVLSSLMFVTTLLPNPPCLKRFAYALSGGETNDEKFKDLPG